LINGRQNPITKWTGLNILTLLAIAVAHPLYDLLVKADHATIFVAHQTEAIDIYLLVVILSLVLPLFLVFITWAAGRLSPALGLILLTLLFLLSTLALFSMLGKKYLPESGYLSSAFIILSALLFTLLYSRSEHMRLFLNLMSPAVVIVPLLFLTNPVIGALLQQPESPNGRPPDKFSSLPHIVFIVFDELPLTSLLDDKGMIDAGRYPHFARLAESSTWYRNANTIHYSTRFSIPSILTGTDHWEHFGKFNVNRPHIMLARETFPDNLFSLLENSHKPYALLSSANVIRSTKDDEPYIPDLEERLPFLLSDLVIIYAHQVSPEPLLEKLPGIYGQWQDFAGKQQPQPVKANWPYKGGKPFRIKQLSEALHKSNQPVLYVAHVILPHYPFRYNEKGQLHENISLIKDDRAKNPRGKNIWPNEFTANISYQAHLLQLGFVDRLLGYVMDRLERLNLFDKSLIVVTADHGISFFWDNDKLPPSTLYDVQAGEVVNVPLFIKAPGQSRQKISDEIVQSIDILPTIADMLSIPVPWEVDGISVLSNENPASDRYAWFMADKTTLEKKIDPGFLALKRKLSLFGEGDYDAIYSFGPHKHLLNTTLSDWELQQSTATVEIENKEKYDGIDPGSHELPAYIEGKIKGVSPLTETDDLLVAVSVNEIIRSIVPAQSENEQMRFIVRVPPESFVRGENQIDVFTVVEDESRKPVALARLKQN
jgi:hypothetical protein